MTTETLIENGYKKHEVPYLNEYAKEFYQKKIKDEKGTKYFIDVYIYEYEPFLTNNVHFEFILTTTKEDSYALKIQVYAISDTMRLEDIENKLEEMWVNGNFDYYELY